MAWLASFKGLRGIGVPPVIAALALAAVFIYKRVTADPGKDPNTLRDGRLLETPAAMMQILGQRRIVAVGERRSARAAGGDGHNAR